MDAVTLATTNGRSQPQSLSSTAGDRDPLLASGLQSAGNGQLLSFSMDSGPVRNAMPQSTHDRAAELHNLAAHAHAAAAVAHAAGDHPTAHELTRRAHEHSVSAHEFALKFTVETVGGPSNG
jgi:hypothetical protein